MPTRVLIVDDQAVVRAGFRTILHTEADLTVVGEAADGLAGVAAAERLRPDVVLMDIRMPRLDGVEATRRVTRLAVEPPIRVLILTTFNEDAYVYGALRAGASGFLLKDATPEDIVQAVRVIARGDNLLDPAVTRTLIEAFVRSPVEAPPAPAPELALLTERELDVLRLVAQGLSNAEVAAALFVAESTVKTHVTRVLAKLDLRDRVQAAIFAYEAGVAGPGRV